MQVAAARKDAQGLDIEFRAADAQALPADWSEAFDSDEGFSYGVHSLSFRGRVVELFPRATSFLFTALYTIAMFEFALFFPIHCPGATGGLEREVRPRRGGRDPEAAADCGR